MIASHFNSVLFADLSDAIVSGLDPDQRFVLIIVVIGCATAVVCTIAGTASATINSIYRRRAETDMKREMIERGMSADEITKVVEAAAPLDNGAQRWIASWCKRAKSS